LTPKKSSRFVKKMSKRPLYFYCNQKFRKELAFALRILSGYVAVHAPCEKIIKFFPKLLDKGNPKNILIFLIWAETWRSPLGR